MEWSVQSAWTFETRFSSQGVFSYVTAPQKGPPKEDLPMAHLGQDDAKNGLWLWFCTRCFGHHTARKAKRQKSKMLSLFQPAFVPSMSRLCCFQSPCRNPCRLRAKPVEHAWLLRYLGGCDGETWWLSPLLLGCHHIRDKESDCNANVFVHPRVQQSKRRELKSKKRRNRTHSLLLSRVILIRCLFEEAEQVHPLFAATVDTSLSIGAVFQSVPKYGRVSGPFRRCAISSTYYGSMCIYVRMKINCHRRSARWRARHGGVSI